VHQSEVCGQRGLYEVGLAVEFDASFPLFGDGADTRWREDAAETVTCRSDSLDEGSLRYQLHLEIA
jgi:hypothetical protein